MKNKTAIIALFLTFITINIYLFVEAPKPLPDNTISGQRLYPVTEAFKLLSKENDVIRTLYTKCIVGEGKKQNLKFDERWEKKDVEAGPLPALFLRSTAAFLIKNESPLGLFLGSDFPISSANKFKGKQTFYYEQMKKDKLPKFFFDESAQKYTALFPDYATADACASCHNMHKDSPKKDWKKGDMMGATTWTYPKDSLSLEEIKNLLDLYRKGAASTYSTYIRKVEGFSGSPKPVIGTTWPANGYFLPSAEVFLDSATKISAPATYKSILSLNTAIK